MFYSFCLFSLGFLLVGIIPSIFIGLKNILEDVWFKICASISGIIFIAAIFGEAILRFQ